ncbi:tyrosine-type recombinase/integrase [uncultured Methylophaga sp.]|uniref:tyrosine-type recombinase/integrase n=1 Tax=uncultured Methylophaga sp. TaxID=285271 RepID=UPI00260599A0|nr:tyrosine-type recombinase/integrase [uncultured Methylophaga sp.]
MRKTDNAYLKQRGKVFHLQLPVPKRVRELYLKEQEFITGSLQTRHLDEAMGKRDLAVAKCRQLFKIIIDANVELSPSSKLSLAEILADTSGVLEAISEATGKRPPTSLFTNIATEVTLQGELADAAMKRGDLEQAESYRANIDVGYDTLLDHLAGKPRLTDEEERAYSKALYSAGGFITIGTLTDKYIEANQGFPLKTKEKKARHSRRLIKFLGSDKVVTEVSPKEASEFVQDLNLDKKLKVKSKRDVISDLDAIWSYGERHLMTRSNPWTGRRKDITESNTGKEKTRYPWKNSQVVELCEALIRDDNEFKETLIPYTLVGLFSGIRISEIAELTLDDIELDNIIKINITRGKNQATVREIALHPRLKPLLARLIENSNDGMLIPNTDGARGRGIRGSWLFSKFKRELFGDHLKQYTYHSFRHRFEDIARESEMPGFITDKLLGHKAPMYGQGVSLRKQEEWLLKMEQGVQVDQAVEQLIKYYLERY